MQSPKHLVPREINVNPLVDLTLVLLILLVVVAPMLRRDPVPPQPRPRPAGAAAPAMGPQGRLDHLAVAIGADGAVFVDQRRVAREELSDLLIALHDAGPNRPVLVKGDRRVSYSQVRQLMAELYRAGFQRVSLLT
jgi:biopolymer transport protein TolR